MTPLGTLTVVVTGDGASTFGNNVTFSATLSGSSTATGNVTFKDSYAATIAGCANHPLSGNTATCTTSALAYGSHSISAIYAGDAGNPATLSPAFAHVVNAGWLSLDQPVFIPTFASGSVVFVYPAIRNAGTLPLDLIGLRFTGSFCLGNNTCGPTLAAGAACAVEVRYAPATASAQIAGTMQVTHTGANSTFVVDLTAATNSLTLPILSAAFNPVSVAAGSANAKLTLALRNPNPVPLTNVDIYFNLPGNMLTAAVPDAASSCSGGGAWGPASYLGGGSLAGRTAAEWAGGTVPAKATCALSIAVIYSGGPGTPTVSSFPFNATGLTTMFAPATLTVTQAPVITAATAVATEFFLESFHHYFYSTDSAETAAVAAGAAGPWARTGSTWGAWSAAATSPTGSVPVCRFYGSVAPGPNSHFFTAAQAECDQLQQVQSATPSTPKRWNYEGIAFYAPPTVSGACPGALVPLLRLYNNGIARGEDSNHRHVIDGSVIPAMQLAGWTSEGAVMCVEKLASP